MSIIMIYFIFIVIIIIFPIYKYGNENTKRLISVCISESYTTELGFEPRQSDSQILSHNHVFCCYFYTPCLPH